MKSLLNARRTGWTVSLGVFAAIMLWTLNRPAGDDIPALYENTMAMSTAAFQDAIVFAHLRYHARGAKNQPQLDYVAFNDLALDFNAQGFPVGTELDQYTVKLPITQGACRDLWQSLLSPMRPYVEPESYASLSVRAIANRCEFTFIDYPSHKIVYAPERGLVSMVSIR